MRNIRLRDNNNNNNNIEKLYVLNDIFNSLDGYFFFTMVFYCKIHRRDISIQQSIIIIIIYLVSNYRVSYFASLRSGKQNARYPLICSTIFHPFSAQTPLDNSPKRPGPLGIYTYTDRREMIHYTYIISYVINNAYIVWVQCF